MPLIIPSNTITGGYEVDNSLRFDDGSSDSLSKTFSSSGNRQLWTFSAWVKLANLTQYRQLLQVDTSGSDVIYFSNVDTIRLVFGGNSVDVSTTALFRDVSAWYHVVVNYNGTTLKLWVNGIEYISQSMSGNTKVNDSSYVHYLSGGFKWDGYMSEVVFIDGQALDETSFGEFDADSGIWKPKNVSGLTFGTNGFYLDFENSGSLGADVSGNSNNFTVNNLTSDDQMIDTPTNNWFTLNPLCEFTPSTSTYSQGNLRFENVNGSGSTYARTELDIPSTGIWYYEVMLKGSFAGYQHAFGTYDKGVSVTSLRGTTDSSRSFTGCHLIEDDGQYWVDGVNTATYSTFADGDILQVWFDADNGDLYLGKNGSAFNSGSPVESGLSNQVLHFMQSAGSNYCIINFGQDSTFAGNTTAGNNTDSNDIGDFKYSVPTGALALCTSNLATDG